ncbi:MAG: ceramidase domain-containing protein [Rickettsiales bacterium]|nr:ceramidase domain-containing protein [Rickettsiales bacterium]
MALMALSDHVDEYCERIDFAFWAEPTNAITNFLIIFAGLAALRLYNKQFPLHGKKHRPNILILIGLIILTGVGSFLYHTLATVWAGYADIIPIIGFIYLYHAVFLRRALAMPYHYVLGYMVAFFGISAFLGATFGREALNGSIGYVPVLISFYTIWVAMLALRRPGAKLFGTTALVFLLAITFRSIDMQICDYFPLGTHFLWHALNSVVLFLLMKIIIQLPDYYQRHKRDGFVSKSRIFR